MPPITLVDDDDVPAEKKSEAEAKPKRGRKTKPEAEVTSARNKDGTWEYEVLVKGISPMLQNPATEEVLDDLQFGARVKKASKKEIPTPQLAFGRVCRGPEGEHGIPAGYMFSSLVNGGRHVIFDKKTKMSNRDESLIPAFLSIETELVDDNGDFFIPFCHEGAQVGNDLTRDDLTGLPSLKVIDAPDYAHIQKKLGGKPLAWTTDRRKGNLKQGAGKGVAVALVRPKFPAGWKLKFRIKVDHDQVDISKIEDLIKKTGLYQGIGDYRPSCKGQFGRFKLLKITEIGKVEEEVEEAEAA